MNGPEHWREADLILTGDSDRCSYGCPHSGCPHEMAMIARAIGHGLLALAAAVVDGPAVMRPEDRNEWDHATGRLEREEDEPEPEPYDPGPECDDEGGMSEYRHILPEDYERGQL